VWIMSLTSCLRLSNYSKLEVLTRPSSFLPFLETTHEADQKAISETVSLAASDTSNSNQSGLDLSSRAFHRLVDSLRCKAREKTWHIICSAYRELACHPDARSTRDWLERSLSLPSTVPACKGMDVDEWLEKKNREGQVRRKDDPSEGRWVICKVK
jgi:hypothetical protein